MSEQTLAAPATTEPLPLAYDIATDYVDSLGTARTSRHASEESFNSPHPDETNQAVKLIRADITQAIAGAMPEYYAAPTAAYLNGLKTAYWQRASRVGVEFGARAGYDMEDYFTIESGRSYDEIKAEIEHDYEVGSIPRSVLGAIDRYHTVLNINPAHATTITMELIGRNLAAIKQRADDLVATTGCLPQDATAQAFASYLDDTVELHAETVLEKYGGGDDAIRPVFNKASFYPTNETLEDDDTTLILSEDDAAGFVQVYDIQSRPYNQIELTFGNEIAHMPEMQIAMLHIHEGLLDVSRQYLAAHPERAAMSLENFSEIFVPANDDGVMNLLPNPKLIRAMVNNFMPAIGRALMERETYDGTVESSDIDEGIRIAAKEFKLFQSKIAQLNNHDPINRTVEMKSAFQVVCPANAVFPNYLAAHLARYYEEAGQTLQVLASADAQSLASE